MAFFKTSAPIWEWFWKYESGLERTQLAKTHGYNEQMFLWIHYNQVWLYLNAQIGIQNFVLTHFPIHTVKLEIGKNYSYFAMSNLSSKIWIDMH